MEKEILKICSHEIDHFVVFATGSWLPEFISDKRCPSKNLFHQIIYFCKEEHELLNRMEVRFSSSLFSSIVPSEESVRRIFSLDLLLFAIIRRMEKRWTSSLPHFHFFGEINLK